MFGWPLHVLIAVANSLFCTEIDCTAVYHSSLRSSFLGALSIFFKWWLWFSFLATSLNCGLSACALTYSCPSSCSPFIPHRYEPYKAIVKGPSEFGKALGRGGQSFGMSVFGTATKVVSLSTGAVGSGLAALTMDTEYQAQRDLNKQNRPTSVSSGFARGFKSFGSGLAGGLTGIVTQPIKGAKSGGFLGALKGVGKGVVGVVTKPTSGLADMVSTSLAGLEAGVSGRREQSRVRKPRFIASTGAVSFMSTPDTSIA